MSIFTSLLLILLLVVVSAFLSCAEISIAASRKIRLEMMSKEGVHNADRIDHGDTGCGIPAPVAYLSPDGAHSPRPGTYPIQGVT